ncbi:sulfatase family protein [Amycolatopsis jejuensis]|uniref:sulfatase family protein n=1 Tax=Amycolatopsis jejuensis TaxID=330084 RepID=UPI000AB61FAB|nr:sulfatase-like hydrolase/transferase [Amycolatopsis jejuensis]
MPMRPNILLITADQHRADVLGVEGRKVSTPHLDRLAGSGARFTSCVTPSPVCQPARASVLTGLLPLTHGVWDNGVELDEAVADRGFAGVLGRAGYRTGLFGKAHFSNYLPFGPSDRPEAKSGSVHYGAEWSGPYMGFEQVELAVMPHNLDAPLRPPGGLHYERWLAAQAGQQEIDDLVFRNLDPDVTAAQTWTSALPAAWHSSTWVADRTISFLRDCAEEPFAAWASFPDPHHPFDCPEPWSSLHDPAEVDLPPHRGRDFERRPWWHEQSQLNEPAMDNAELVDLRKNYSRISEQPDDQLRQLIANYYGMVSLIDHNVGRILAELAATGALENTYVVYTSDHGDWLGDHGLVLKGPMLYEGLWRVPLLMSGPTVPAGAVVEDPVSTVDLAGTFLDWAAVPAQQALHSQPLQPVLDGAARSHALGEWTLHPSRCGVELDLRAVRTTTHKLVVDRISGAAELYDLAADPHEMVNLAESPEHKPVREDLENLLATRPGDHLDELPEPTGTA